MGLDVYLLQYGDSLTCSVLATKAKQKACVPVKGISICVGFDTRLSKDPFARNMLNLGSVNTSHCPNSCLMKLHSLILSGFIGNDAIAKYGDNAQHVRYWTRSISPGSR